MIRVGITGAAGFVGTALVEHLARVEGVHVVALARTPSLAYPHFGSEVEWREGDLASPYDVAGFVADLECVVHLAHKGSPFTSGRDLASDASANLVPTLTLLQAIRDRRQPCHVVFASSGGALYAGLPAGSLATETSPIRLTTSYAIQKATCEDYLRLGSDEGWLTATVLRIGNAYGAALPLERLQGFIGVAVSRLRAGEPLRLIGDPGNVRDYIHLRDVCTAFSLALARRSSFDVFNIGTGQGTSVDELIALLRDVSGIRPVVERVPGTPAAERLPRWVVLDASKARDVLGWQPTVSLREGLEELWKVAAP